MPKIKPTPAFLAVFMEAVAEQYRWAAALDFVTAVNNVKLVENRDAVTQVFMRYNYLPADVTDARLQSCIDHIFPAPPTFKVGDVVRYTGSDLTPHFLSDTKEIVITDVNAAVSASEYSYAAGGVAWIPHADLEFIRQADDDSIETAWFSSESEETGDEEGEDSL